MLSQVNPEQVYLACGSTDLRKSIDGLAAVVIHSFALDPFSHCLFVFCNRERNKLKILHWDHNGFWLYYRRLERGRFRWPARGEEQARAISRRQLQWLLDGLELEQRRAHASVSARIVV
ncbi:MAG: IS66 family insertion sequence element accessory protein TnpB [Aestuariivirga sp.]|uniref:IS66 family insertion sequence element accessory protein TnpB n=1 Tax=Aestuariivirga sp. TaxID=2650926 RepID=UPI0030191C24